MSDSMTYDDAVFFLGGILHRYMHLSMGSGTALSSREREALSKAIEELQSARWASEESRQIATPTVMQQLADDSLDLINHPPHYTAHPSGIECITVVEHLPYNRGCAVKYLWRADLKGSPIEDLKKAAWYCNREIERLQKDGR